MLQLQLPLTCTLSRGSGVCCMHVLQNTAYLFPNPHASSKLRISKFISPKVLYELYLEIYLWPERLGYVSYGTLQIRILAFSVMVWQFMAPQLSFTKHIVIYEDTEGIIRSGDSLVS